MAVTAFKYIADFKNFQRFSKVLKDFQRMVGVAGFEPATPRSQSEYSARLSYTPITENMRKSGETLRLNRDIV